MFATCISTYMEQAQPIYSAISGVIMHQGKTSKPLLGFRKVCSSSTANISVSHSMLHVLVISSSRLSNIKFQFTSLRFKLLHTHTTLVRDHISNRLEEWFF